MRASWGLPKICEGGPSSSRHAGGYAGRGSGGSPFGTFTFSMSVREFLRQATTIKFNSMNFLLYPKKDLLHLLFHLCLFIEDYFHVRIKSKDMLLSELSNQ